MGKGIEADHTRSTQAHLSSQESKKAQLQAQLREGTVFRPTEISKIAFAKTGTTRLPAEVNEVVKAFVDGSTGFKELQSALASVPGDATALLDTDSVIAISEKLHGSQSRKEQTKRKKAAKKVEAHVSAFLKKVGVKNAGALETRRYIETQIGSLDDLFTVDALESMVIEVSRHEQKMQAKVAEYELVELEDNEEGSPGFYAIISTDPEQRVIGKTEEIVRHKLYEKLRDEAFEQLPPALQKGLKTARQQSEPVDEKHVDERTGHLMETLGEAVKSTPDLMAWAASTSAFDYGGSSLTGPALDVTNVVGMVASAVGMHEGRMLLQLSNTLHRRAEVAIQEGRKEDAELYLKHANKAQRQGLGALTSGVGGFMASLAFTAGGAMAIASQLIEAAQQTSTVASSTTSSVANTLSGVSTAVGSAGAGIGAVAGLMQMALGTRNIVKAVDKKVELARFESGRLQDIAEVPGMEAEVRVVMDLIDFKRYSMNTKILGNTLEVVTGSAAVVSAVCAIAVAAGAPTAGIGTAVVAAVSAAVIGAKVGIANGRKVAWKQWQKALVQTGHAESSHDVASAALYAMLKGEIALKAEGNSDKGKSDVVSEQELDLMFHAYSVTLGKETAADSRHFSIMYEGRPLIGHEACEAVFGVRAETFVKMVETAQEHLRDKLQEADPAVLKNASRRWDASRNVIGDQAPLPEEIVVSDRFTTTEKARLLLEYSRESDPVLQQGLYKLLTTGARGTLSRPGGSKQIRKEHSRRKRLILLQAKILKGQRRLGVLTKKLDEAHGREGIGKQYVEHANLQGRVLELARELRANQQTTVLLERAVLETERQGKDSGAMRAKIKQLDSKVRKQQLEMQKLTTELKRLGNLLSGVPEKNSHIRLRRRAEKLNRENRKLRGKRLLERRKITAALAIAKQRRAKSQTQTAKRRYDAEVHIESGLLKLISGEQT